MSLNPQDRKQWHGFLDLMQPPAGYRLTAAVGTTFGLSVDALVAALLAMCDADGEELADNPVAATIAISRLASRVRVLTHPATISGGTAGGAQGAFIRLLDRLVVEIQPETGLFHPKVWALRFQHLGTPRPGMPAEFGRVLVGSRNLSRSTSFEVGAVFDSIEKTSGSDPSEFGKDVGRALKEWLTKANVHYPKPVWALPVFFAGLRFDVPSEASEQLRLRWQGSGHPPLINLLPKKSKRVVVVSPFIQPDFVAELLTLTDTLQVVSLPESLDLLSDETCRSLAARAEAQGTPALYQVTQHGDPDDAFIDGVHAKLVMAEDSKGETVTLVGSANATGPGWGLIKAANVETMVEMRPGLSIDRFVASFIRESRTKIHPWVAEYSREARTEPDEHQQAERQLLAALREVARLEFRLTYHQERRELRVACDAGGRALPPWVAEGRVFSVTPMALLGLAGSWRSLDDARAGCVFEDVEVSQLSSFVVLRGQSAEPAVQCQRIAVARLDVDAALLDERDKSVCSQILKTADPAMVLKALVGGLAHLRPGEGKERGAGRGATSLAQLLDDVSLERLLHAVALDRSLVEEIRKLLAPIHGQDVIRLCDDLDEAVAQVYGSDRT
jgi:hypothetical protein